MNANSCTHSRTLFIAYNGGLWNVIWTMDMNLKSFLLGPICAHYINEMFGKLRLGIYGQQKERVVESREICRKIWTKWLTLKSAEMRFKTDANGRPKLTEVLPEKDNLRSISICLTVKQYHIFVLSWWKSQDVPPPDADKLIYVYIYICI